MSGRQFTSLLDACFARMACPPLTEYLKRTLIIIVLAAFEAAPGMAATYLENEGLTGDFITTVKSLVPEFRFPQERKLFVRGFLGLLESHSLPSAFL